MRVGEYTFPSGEKVHKVEEITIERMISYFRTAGGFSTPFDTGIIHLTVKTKCNIEESSYLNYGALGSYFSDHSANCLYCFGDKT